MIKCSSPRVKHTLRGEKKGGGVSKVSKTGNIALKSAIKPLNKNMIIARN
jgi:hypothetical protein